MKISSEEYTTGSNGVSCVLMSSAEKTSSFDIKLTLSVSTVLKLTHRCLDENDLKLAALLVLVIGTQHLEAVLIDAIERNCLTMISLCWCGYCFGDAVIEY